MAIKRLSSASIATGSKSNKFWDQDTAQGAYVPLGFVEYTSTGSGVGFNVPDDISSYTHLVYVANVRNNTSGAGFVFYFNGDVGSGNYSYTWYTGEGSTPTSGRSTSQNYLNWSQTPSTADGDGIYGTHIFHITNINSGGNPYRTVLYRGANDKNGSASGTTTMMALTWRQAASLSAITFGASGGVFMAGSTFALYGIKGGA